MSITLKELKHAGAIEKLIIHSLSCRNYQAAVLLDGEEHYVVDKSGKPISHFNVAGLQALFEKLPVKQRILRQQSAYDEMVGQPVREADNTLEVSLCSNSYGDTPPQLQEHL